jgi:putative hydrolase of the HAD superfamily
MIQAVLFDFGGVIAEEGFRNGLRAIARKHDLDPDNFFDTAHELVYSTGYVLGRADESAYWKALRKETGITTAEGDLRKEILDRFTIRPEMVDIAQDLKRKGFTVGILSDQTNWLDELNKKYRFFRHFDPVFNSYYLHTGKEDASLFIEICNTMGLNPEEVLLIDDSEDNVDRASSKGLKAIHFKNLEQLRDELNKFLK